MLALHDIHLKNPDGVGARSDSWRVVLRRTGVEHGKPLGAIDGGDGVELRQLEHFLAVVETGSFSAAAARLYMVQSSLSSSLLNLERELGTELFIRGRRGAQLTEAGRALVGPARAAIAEMGRGKDAVAAVRGLLRGSVRMATVAVPGSFDLIHTIRAFHQEHPGVDLHLLHDGARDLVGLVADARVDFALTPMTRETTPALAFEPLVRTPLVVLCSAGHRLAGAREVDPRDLLDETIIDLPRGWRIRDLFDRLLAERGLERHVQIEVDEWFGVLTMVRRDLGISYGPRACVDPEVFSDVAWATVADAPSWDLGIVTRNETLRGAAGQAFLAAYRKHCSAQPLASG
jgi:DNA-binding transcriptional LysR family regulator